MLEYINILINIISIGILYYILVLNKKISDKLSSHNQTELVQNFTNSLQKVNKEQLDLIEKIVTELRIIVIKADQVAKDQSNTTDQIMADLRIAVASIADSYEKQKEIIDEQENIIKRQKDLLEKQEKDNM